MSCFDRLIRADIHSLIEVKHPEQKTITALRSSNSYFLGSFSRFLYLGIGVNVSNLWPVNLQRGIKNRIEHLEWSFFGEEERMIFSCEKFNDPTT